jgi:ArsR family transcriptional regulator, arsenate/arsenite/antimonite-responsive transcriptional repressor
MSAEARFFESLADETRLKILWILPGTNELCVYDVIDVLKITQSKASRHPCYLYHLGWVTDRRDGLWMNYRLTVTPGSPREKLLKLLEEMLAPQPKVQALRGQLAHCLEAKQHTECAKRVKPESKSSRQSLSET